MTFLDCRFVCKNGDSWPTVWHLLQLYGCKFPVKTSTCVGVWAITNSLNYVTIFNNIYVLLSFLTACVFGEIISSWLINIYVSLPYYRRWITQIWNICSKWWTFKLLESQNLFLRVKSLKQTAILSTKSIKK